MQRVARPVDHRKAKDRRCQGGRVEQRALDRNLVIVVGHPTKDSAQCLEDGRRIGREFRAERRLLAEWNGFERALLETVEHAARAVDVHAAQGHDARRDVAKHIDELASLAARAQHEVDDDVGSKCTDCRGRFVKPVPIAGDSR